MFNNHYTPLNKIYLSKSNLLWNISRIKEISKKHFYFPVLKSNAYGHDLKTIYSILKNENFPLVCVDSIYEAFQIYRINRNQQVLVMGYIDPENLKIKKLPFQYVVWSLDQINRISKHQPSAKFHLFIDTNMHREGIDIDELKIICESMSNEMKSNIVGIMSHYSSSDEVGNSSNESQNVVFNEAIKIVVNSGINPKYIHIEASAGTLFKLSNVANSVRMGLDMYGISPVSDSDFNLKPVLSFITHIVQIKEIKLGGMVQWKFKKLICIL